jgi:hypothetical protein
MIQNPHPDYVIYTMGNKGIHYSQFESATMEALYQESMDLRLVV